MIFLTDRMGYILILPVNVTFVTVTESLGANERLYSSAHKTENLQYSSFVASHLKNN